MTEHFGNPSQLITRLGFVLGCSGLFSFLVDSNCIAQEFKASLKPRVVYEKDFEHTVNGVNATFCGILNRKGTELLLNDTANVRFLPSIPRPLLRRKFRSMLSNSSAIRDGHVEDNRPMTITHFLIKLVMTYALKNQKPRWTTVVCGCQRFVG